MINSAYLAPGDVLTGRYEIVRELGRGGFSVVYLARDRDLDAPVAVKLLVPPPAGAQLARERMRREVQVVRGLAHANIVGVHDFLEEGTWSFVVMEYVDGPDLAVRVRDRGPLGAEEAARLGSDVGAALAIAHRRGILHRDVKPQNILLEPDGRARLTDFGAARLEGQATVTRTGALVGTLLYLAPEVVAGARADARADVYGLGLTLYYAVTGRLPDAASPHLPPAPAVEGHHPRALRIDLPVWLDAIVARATSSDPARRYHSATSLLDALSERDPDRALRALKRAPALDFCLRCGSAAAAGLATCPDCRQAPVSGTDTLVFVDPPAEFLDRQATHTALETLLTGLHRAPDLAGAAAGRRALVRVPSATAGAVVEQLRIRGVPVRTAPVGRAWSAVPSTFYVMAAGTLVAGVAAGAAAMPMLLVTAPVMSGMLLLGGHRAVQNPLLASRARRSALPTALDRRLSATLAELPHGSARSLLNDLVRIGESVCAGPDSAAVADDLVQLLSHAGDAARDLAGIDDTLAVMEKRREAAVGQTAWMDGHAALERSRDRLVQQLLEALTVVGRLQGRTQAAGDTAGGQLAEVARELAARSDADAAARKEVEALLA
ncbi:MAG TPA: serine/threonine-protein kinase [Gemmatimonadales bacterium]